jgi:phage shock protein C
MTQNPVQRGQGRLMRSRDDKWVAGVCGGVARYTGVDANLIRLVVVLGTIFGFGSLLVAYVVAWILMPQEP